jgi:hypothetical protein
MSSYNNSDQSSCVSCMHRSSYSTLGNTTNYSCDQQCLCRFTGDRSVKDKMYYNWFVLNQPMILPQQNKPISVPKNNNCGQK